MVSSILQNIFGITTSPSNTTPRLSTNIISDIDLNKDDLPISLGIRQTSSINALTSSKSQAADHSINFEELRNILKGFPYKYGDTIFRKYRLFQFHDLPRIREIIFEKVLKNARAIPPITNASYILTLEDVDYEGKKEFTLADEKKAILNNDTLGWRLRGTLVLKDHNGNLVSQKRITLAIVPYLTSRGTFIINGIEYTLANQLRLKPAIYHRWHESGNLIATVNILPGQGIPHYYWFNPVTGIFMVEARRRKAPLIDLLYALGATDEEIIEAIGETLFQKNKRISTGNYDHVASLFVPSKQLLNVQDKSALLKSIFSTYNLDPDSMEFILGKPYKTITKEVILDSMKKLIKIYKDEVSVDDKDDMAYQINYGPDDIIAEKIWLAKNKLYQIMFKATNRKDLKFVQPGIFQSYLLSPFGDSGLGMYIEGTNIVEFLEHRYKVTRLGYGGISSIESVPMAVRDVHPSQYGFIDIIRTSESLKAGVDLRYNTFTFRDDKNNIYTLLYDRINKKIVLATPAEVKRMTIGFIDNEAIDPSKPAVSAIKGGEIIRASKSQVQYYFIPANEMWNPTGVIMPLKQNIINQRALMGMKMMTQSLPLVEKDTPLVITKSYLNNNRSYIDMFKHYFGVIKAKSDGVVLDVTDDHITVKYSTDPKPTTYQLVNELPLGNDVSYTIKTNLKPGDKFKPGQVITYSNFTDEKGNLAIGRNLKVVYMPYYGLNYEDAFVISESAAKKLAAERLITYKVPKDEFSVYEKSKYLGIYPGKYTSKQLENISDSGVIRPGSKVVYGDPIILSARRKTRSHKTLAKSSRISSEFADDSIVWDNLYPGEVVDVIDTKKYFFVTVRAVAPMVEGDKMAGLYADKGVVARIIPDHLMPKDSNGEPFDVVANPLGIISRANVSQIYEAVLGKVAKKLGKPIEVYDFDPYKENWLDEVENILRQHNISPTEKVYDPISGKYINALTGYRYFLRLHHTAKSKAKGRSIGEYTEEDIPSKAGEESAKKLSVLDIYALLSHGATKVIRDAKLIKGQNNIEYWTKYMAGQTPPDPDVPLVYEKFINMLKASGINVERTGYVSRVMPMTQKEIDKLVEHRRILKPETVIFEDFSFKPIPGGFFDPAITGGHGGRLWSYIQLTEPIPNPIMERNISILLDIPIKKLEEIVAGKETLNGMTGTQAIYDALDKIDLQHEKQRLLEIIRSGSRTARDKAIKKLGIIQGAIETGVHPREWFMNKVPVIPPVFRPVSILITTKSKMVNDANFLYKEVFVANDVLEKLKQYTDDVANERLNLYRSVKALYGLMDPTNSRLVSKNVKGFLAHIFGSSPKYSYMQQKLISANVDLVGRAVVVPDPDLSMDEVGLPENKAWTIYMPFVVSRMVKSGIPVHIATNLYRMKHPIAKEHLIREMSERPVLVNRAPVLHKFGHMAFWPKLVVGEALHVNPIVIVGFNMDFDGDASNYYVPVSDAAVREAIWKMTPSRNLYAPRDFDIHYIPHRDSLAGLYLMTMENFASSSSKKQPVYFKKKKDVIKALRNNEIDYDTPVIILEETK